MKTCNISKMLWNLCVYRRNGPSVKSSSDISETNYNDTDDSNNKFSDGHLIFGKVFLIR